MPVNTMFKAHTTYRSEREYKAKSSQCWTFSCNETLILSGQANLWQSTEFFFFSCSLVQLNLLWPINSHFIEDFNPIGNVAERPKNWENDPMC